MYMFYTIIVIISHWDREQLEKAKMTFLFSIRLWIRHSHRYILYLPLGFSIFFNFLLEIYRGLNFFYYYPLKNYNSECRSLSLDILSIACIILFMTSVKHMTLY